MTDKPHVCKGYVFPTAVSPDAEVATGDLPLTLRRISGTTAIEATIGYETVLLTGPQVAKFWEMVQKVRDDLPYAFHDTEPFMTDRSVLK